MSTQQKNFWLIVAAVTVPTAISYWSLAGFAEYWKYPAEFGVYGWLLRALLPASIGLAILVSSREMRQKRVLLVTYVVVMNVWLYHMPVIGVVLVCAATGNCL